MTFKRWLKKIVLFPLSIIMGVNDGDGDAFNPDTLREIAGPADMDPRPLGERIMAFAGNPDAQFMQVQDAPAGKGEAADADQPGNQGDTEDGDEGLGTQSEEDGQDADLDEDADEGADDSTGQETEETGEGKKKGIKQKKLDERLAEMEQKILNKLKAQSQTDDDPPDWVEVNQKKVDDWITETEEKIDALRLEGNYTEARKLSRQIDATERDLEENEKRRVAWTARQEARKNQTTSVEAARKELDTAAELYRAEMKIEPETWNRMGVWFEGQINSKPLLVEEFNDIYQKQGKVAAIRFAHQYTLKNMGQTTKKANEEKEKSKTKAAALTATTTGKAPPVDLKKAKAEFEANPTPEAFQKYKALQRQALAA